MTLRDLVHALYLRYQDAMWLANQAKAEAYKPLSVLNEYLLLIGVFKLYGISFSLFELVSFYVVLQFVFIVVGWFLVRLGIVKYNTRLGNKQNPELLNLIALARKIYRAVQHKKR